jgi:thioredoxin reductase (NADPH)
MTEKVFHYDVTILGAGPAGLTAAIYASRYGMDTLVISKDIGGMANLAHKIENYPGYEGSGFELMKKFQGQAEKNGAEFLHEEVFDVSIDEDGFVVQTSKNTGIHTKTIIVSLGTEKRKLGVSGEDSLLGKGVSYCATCDAPFFKNKTVAVVGGSDSAAMAAMILAEHSKKVYVVYRGKDLRCEGSVLKNLKKNKKIEILCNRDVKEIAGKEAVESIILDDKRKVEVDGVFIEIGNLPVTNIAYKLGVKIDENKYIHVNQNMETNVRGIFAAGDAVKSKLKQVVVASAQGATAAKSAFDYVNCR